MWISNNGFKIANNDQTLIRKRSLAFYSLTCLPYFTSLFSSDHSDYLVAIDLT